MSQVNSNNFLVAPCLMEAPWHPTVGKHVGRHLSLVSYHIKTSSWMFQWAGYSRICNHCIQPFGCSEMCVVHSLPQSVRQWQGQLQYLQQKFTISAGKMECLVSSTQLPNNATSASKLDEFWSTYLGLE